MSVTIDDFIHNLNNVDVDKITSDVIKVKMDDIVDLNREDQIFQRGEDAKGRSLSKYSPRTQKIYNRHPPADLYGGDKAEGRTFNLFWTGTSYKGFKAWSKGRIMYITTNERGQKLLERNSSADIFGLNPENAEIANWEIILPVLNERIQKILF